MMEEGAWRRLAWRVGIGMALAVVAVLVGPFLMMRIQPVLAVLVGAVAGVLVWAFTEFLGPEPGPEWEQPTWRRRSAFLQADVRTRRLAHSLSQAQPGRGFDARRVAAHLAQITARRLVTSGRASPEDPLAGADAHLSPALLAYLRSAESPKPAVLSRAALHTHLKEIDSL